MYSNNWTRFDSCLKTFPSLTPFIADGFAVSHSFKRYYYLHSGDETVIVVGWESWSWIICGEAWSEWKNNVVPFEWTIQIEWNVNWWIQLDWCSFGDLKKIIRNRTSVVCNVPLYILITSTNDTLKNTHFLKKWPISGRIYFWPMNLAFSEWIFKFLEFLKNFQGMMDKIFYHGKHDSGECHL